MITNPFIRNTFYIINDTIKFTDFGGKDGKAKAETIMTAPPTNQASKENFKSPPAVSKTPPALTKVEPTTIPTTIAILGPKTILLFQFSIP